jgi:ABC-2 type transport system permease protein
MSPSLFFLTLVVQPIFQILLFAYIGRAADVRSDEFYVVGNAMQYAAVPCLFAMTQTIAGERYQQTLGYILISPAGRLPLFLGRALPVILNGFVVAAFSLIVGGLILGVTFSTSVLAPLAVVVLVSSVSCTGLGLINAGLGLRIRETSVLSNILVGILLIFCGANVAISSLPHWMAQISSWLPLTHAIEAARTVADGSSLTSVQDLLGRELGVGLIYAVAGLAIIRFFETQSRRHATLGIA